MCFPEEVMYAERNSFFNKSSISTEDVTSRVLSELPSENDFKKISLFKCFLLKKFVKKIPNRIAFEVKPNINNHLIPAAAQIPREIIKKKITNSKDDLTGFLNLTIERAPIIPRDKAILPEITLVIEYVTIGRSIRVALPEKVLIQF